MQYPRVRISLTWRRIRRLWGGIVAAPLVVPVRLAALHQFHRRGCVLISNENNNYTNGPGGENQYINMSACKMFDQSAHLMKPASVSAISRICPKINT